MLFRSVLVLASAISLGSAAAEPVDSLASPAVSAEPAVSSESAATAAAPASALDMPIEKIAESTDGCAVLDRDFPGLREHPMYGSFKRMTLNQIAAMSGGKITPEMLARARSDLSTLSASATPMAISATP